MNLYHGTSSTYLNQILEQGLQPTSKTKSPPNWEFPSHPETVSLTTAYALPFAMRAVQVAGGMPMVLRVRVKPRKLVADEDYMEQSTRHQKPAYTSRAAMIRATIKKQAQIKTTKAKNSIKCMGCANHLGPIKPENILTIATIDTKQEPQFLLLQDPSISIINYTIMGPHHVAITKWLTGAPYKAENISRFLPALPPRDAITVVSYRRLLTPTHRKWRP